jgi:hypothetical protein
MKSDSYCDLVDCISCYQCFGGTHGLRIERKSRFCLNTLPVGISVRMATVLSHSCRDILLLFALFVWESRGRIIVDTSENFKPQYYSTAVRNTVLAAQPGCFWWKLGVTSLTKIKENEYFKKWLVDIVIQFCNCVFSMYHVIGLDAGHISVLPADE